MPKTTQQPQSTQRSLPIPRGYVYDIRQHLREQRRNRRKRKQNPDYRKLERGQHLHNYANWLHIYNNMHSKKTKMQKKLKKWHAKKQQFPGKIVFMKVGDFFEVFNEDADIFHKEFGFLYMKGGIAWTGFPRNRFFHYLNQLQEKGYNDYVLENF